MISKSDWKLRKVIDLAEIEPGGTPSTLVSEYWNGENFWATPTDITASNGKYISSTSRMVSSSGLKHVSKVLPAGSILLCTRATIGVAKINTVPITTNQGFKNLVPRSRVCNEWLYYVLQTKIEEMKSLSSGSTFLELGTKQLGNIEISTPTYEEQIAIAKALSDTDELIAVTAQLLNKKERIFEGVLQTEFSESSGATLTMVSDICEVTKGSAVKYDKDFVQGSFGFVNGGINFSGSTEFANDSGDTVVISEGGNSCGFVKYIPKAFWCGGHAYRLIGFKGKQKYLYYALKKSEKEIMNLRVGSGLPNVQKKNLSDFKTPIHQSSNKQEEVVKFLDSLTFEIDYLKVELAKYEWIKQGMAHDLLTGKVRLV